MEKYEIIRTLGKGGQGEVSLYKDTRDGKLVAIKRYRKTRDNIEAEMYKEIELVVDKIGSNVHPNIVKVYEIINDKFHTYIVMEYIVGDNLYKYLSVSRDMVVVFEIMYKLLDAVQFLHSLGIVYRDLKPENIMMRGNTPVLVDMGGACFYNPYKHTVRKQLMCSDTFGTPLYMAPETLNNSVKSIGYVSSEIYSLGMIFYFILSGQEGFSDVKNIQDLREEKVTRVLRLDECPYVKLKEIVEKMISIQPIRRPKLEEVREIVEEYIEMSKSLIILDVDDLLVRRAYRFVPDGENPDEWIEVGKYYIKKRKNLIQFMDELISRSINIGIWSSSVYQNMDPVLKAIFPKHIHDKILFILDRSYCDLDPDYGINPTIKSYATVKNIDRIISNPVYNRERFFNIGNIIIVDNSLTKLRFNPKENNIVIEDFESDILQVLNHSIFG